MFIRNANISGVTLTDKIPVTWDPNQTSSVLILSNNNLTLTRGVGAQNHLSYATKSKSSGKWYCEMYIDDLTDTNSITFGVVEPGHSLDVPPASGSWPGDTALSYGIYSNDGTVWNDGNEYAYEAYVFDTDDLIMMALDMDNGKIYWGVDGTWFNSGDPAAQTNPAFTGLSGAKYTALSLLDEGTTITINFGATAFSYSPPSGFLPW
jgi:hypothetical protein